MPRFQDVLSQPLDTFEKPPLPPKGTYVCKVTKAAIWGAVGENNRYETLTFPVALVSPTDDVDTAELEAYGDLSQAFPRLQFFNDTDPEFANRSARTFYEIRQFLNHLGFDDSTDMRVAIADSIGCEFLGTLTWQPRKDNTEVFDPVIKTTAPL